MIDGSAFVPGLIVFLIMLLAAIVLFFGFGFAICRGVLREPRRSRSTEPDGRAATP